MGLAALILLASVAVPDVVDSPGLRRVEDGVVLRRVDEGVADRGPLGLSLRDMQVDLALPGGFRGVYRVGGRPGDEYGDPSGQRDDLLMRQSGAVIASFSRSVYRRDKEGNTVIDVPPGTVFSIGFPRWMAGTEIEARRIAAAERRDVKAAAIAGAMPIEGRADLRFSGLDGLAMPSGLADLRVDFAMPAGRWTRPSARRDKALESAPVDGDRIELVGPTAPDEHVSRVPRAAARGVSDDAPRFTSDESYRRMRVARLLRSLAARDDDGRDTGIDAPPE